MTAPRQENYTCRAEEACDEHLHTLPLPFSNVYTLHSTRRAYKLATIIEFTTNCHPYNILTENITVTKRS